MGNLMKSGRDLTLTKRRRVDIHLKSSPGPRPSLYAHAPKALDTTTYFLLNLSPSFFSLMKIDEEV